MKAGVAAAFLAAGRLAADPDGTGGLDLLFVADEENCSDYGMKWLARQAMLPEGGRQPVDSMEHYLLTFSCI